MAYVFSFLFGLAIGCITLLVMKRRINRKIAGTLRVDRSDPDGPYMFLELEPGSMPDIERSSYVTLKVDTHSYISRE